LEPGRPGRDPGSYERRLLVGGQLQLFFRALPHQSEKAGQHRFRLIQNQAGGRAVAVEVTGHTDDLGVLTGKESGEAHAAPQVSTVAAQVRPAPNDTSSRLSPFPMRPSSSAVHSARGMEAVELLPYSSTVTTTRSRGRPSLRRAASMMRRFAWW